MCERYGWFLADLLRFRPVPLMLLAQVFLFAQASAQESPANSYQNRSSPNSISGEDFSPAGEAGGAPMADFGTLMNLIQMTIDPDDWLAAGGTSSMVPYPAGVWVDPLGRLQRETGDEGRLLGQSQLSRPEAADIPSLAADRVGEEAPRPDWHRKSELRRISLRLLDQYLAAARHSPEMVNPELIRLAGLRQIQYVCLDIDNQDVILAGAADADKAGFFIEDLATVCSLVNESTIPFGCSIEPLHEQLLKAQEYSSSAAASRLLGKSPRQFVQRLADLIDTHEAQVFGMNPRSTTAIALLAADEHMKRVGFGKAILPNRIQAKSYFDFLEEQSFVAPESLVRWWFDYSEEPIHFDVKQSAFEIPQRCVRLLSEQQMMTVQGRRPSGARDPAADAFAEHFSQRIDELRELEPSYSRMCCVFETALGLQLALGLSGMPDLAFWFPTLCGVGQQTQIVVDEPKNVAGLVGWHASRQHGINVAVISGGVTIDPKAKANSTAWRDRPVDLQLTGDRELTSDSLPRWWWD